MAGEESEEDLDPDHAELLRRKCRLCGDDVGQRNHSSFVIQGGILEDVFKIFVVEGTLLRGDRRGRQHIFAEPPLQSGA